MLQITSMLFLESGVYEIEENYAYVTSHLLLQPDEI